MGRHDTYPEADAAELARVLAEEPELPSWHEESPAFNPGLPPAEVLEMGGPISYSQLSDLDPDAFPRIEEEDWREEDRRRAEDLQRDSERWDPVAGRWVT